MRKIVRWTITILWNVFFKGTESSFPEITEGCAMPHVENNQDPHYRPSSNNVE
jgi:hypothetical protein